MDARGRTDERRRCSECGRKYTPAPSTKKTQQTCGTQCRLKRRATQARARYAAELEVARAASRDRKRKLRRRARAGPASRRDALRAEVVELIAREMDGLSSGGWPARADVQEALRRVARCARDAEMSLAGLGCESPGLAEE